MVQKVTQTAEKEYTLNVGLGIIITSRINYFAMELLHEEVL
jgi:hypothetical protein